MEPLDRPASGMLGGDHGLCSVVVSACTEQSIDRLPSLSRDHGGWVRFSRWVGGLDCSFAEADIIDRFVFPSCFLAVG